MRLVLLSMFVFILIYNIKYKDTPNFKAGDCVRDLIHNDKRQVKDVKKFIYNYCKMVDNKCNKNHMMRIHDFDRLMRKVECNDKKNHSTSWIERIW
jgi:hypothetical protein